MINLIDDNPVLQRELRSRIRFRKLHGNAWKVVAVVLALVILRYYYIGAMAVWYGGVNNAGDMWECLLVFLLGLIAIFGTAMAATAITQEREKQTWEILAVTLLPPSQVVFGKWFARQAPLWAGMILAIPGEIVCGWRGGLPLQATLAANLYLLLNCAFFTALGLLCSQFSRRSPTATATSLVLAGVLCIGTLIIDEIIRPLLYTRFGQYDASVLDTHFTTTFNPIVGMLSLIAHWRPGTADLQGPLIVCVIFELFIIVVSISTLISRFGREASV